MVLQELQYSAVNVNDFQISTRLKNALVKNGFSTIQDLERVSKSHLLSLDGVGAKSLFELQQLLKYEHKTSFKKEVKEKDPTLGLKKFIISKFVTKRKPDWGKEIRFASSLVKWHPDIQFWETLKVPFELYSLGYFFSEAGKATLKKHTNENKLEIPSVEQEEPEVKVTNFQAEKLEVTRKPQSLRDLLKYGKR